MNRSATLLGLFLALLSLLVGWLLLAGEEPREPAATRDALAQVQPASAPPSVDDAGASERNDAAQEAERAPQETRATEAPLAQWRLALVDERGVSVVKATVLVLEASGAAWDAASDEQGAVRAPPADGEAQVFVAAVGRPPERFLISRAAGEHSVSLSQPFTRLAGVATVDGNAPAAPLTLVFEGRHALFAELELPEQLRRKLNTAARLSTSTDEAGRFSLDGAPLDWSGNALAPRGHVVRRNNPNEPTKHRVAIERPSSSLVLEFERTPHLVGRMVDAAGDPAPVGAVVRGALHSWGGRSISNSTAPLDAQGRFEFPLREARLEKVVLALECDSGQVARELAGVELRLDARGDLDAGTLVLRPRAALRLRVLDATGLALPKAKARVVGDSAWTETDASGACVVKSATAGAAELRVLARGHWEERLALQLPTDQLVEVRLRRSNRLELEFVDSAGAPLRHVLVRLENTLEPLFRGSNAWWPDGETYELSRGEFNGGGQDTSTVPRGWFDVQPSEDGRITLEGLSPRAAITLSVLDQLGQSLLERDLAPVGETEQRVERVRVDVPLVELSGRVSDALGQPIGGATVRLETSGPYGDPLSSRSDASGLYRFRGLSGARATLNVSADGFVARGPLAVDLVAPARRFDIALERR